MQQSAQSRRSQLTSTAQSSGPKVAISGRIDKVLYTGDRSGRSLLLIKSRDGGQYKVEGPLPVPPQVGMRIQTEAVAFEHPKYGTQYRADLITEEVPIDRPGAIAFMSKTLAGVGKTLAARMYDAFGERVYETIQNHPESLLTVQGMTQEKLVPLLDSWKEHANTRMLWTYLAKYQIGGGTAAKIYAKFGAQSATVAMHRPYQLTAVDGVGFATVDRIALSSGVRRDSVGRVIAALRFTLDSNKKRGNTCCTRDLLVQQTTRLLSTEDAEGVEGVGPSPSKDAVAKAIDECIERDALHQVEVRGLPCITTPAMETLEIRLAEHIKRIVQAPSSHPASDSPADQDPNAKVTDLVAKAREAAEHLGDAAQIDAVAMPFQHTVSVITGGPGCGKTTVTRQITKVAEEAGIRVVMMAPTGKAARRMAEVTERSVDTIHSTLQPDSGDLTTFKCNENNPLEGDLFVVDESTMTDAGVALSLLRAIPAGAKVLFVGDVDQLPSVGPGAVFRDLIQSEVIPVARLNTPHRTALNSDIVVNAHKIIQGQADAVDTAGQRDFTFLDLQDEEAQLAIVKRYQEMHAAYGRDGVQVLAPTYDGIVGVTALNAALQAKVNPPSMDRPEIEHHGTVFRLGDRVMQTSNNKQLNVVNGEVGFVTAVDQEGKGLTVNFSGKEVSLKEKSLLSLDLAYAITIHKSQGSEYPGVITVCSSSASFMLDRNLIYTAVTRAKKHSEIIGSLQAFKTGVRKPGANRWTMLANAIRHQFDLPPLVPPALVVKPRAFNAFITAARAGNNAAPAQTTKSVPTQVVSGSMSRLSLISAVPGSQSEGGSQDAPASPMKPTMPPTSGPRVEGAATGKLSLFKRSSAPEHEALPWQDEVPPDDVFAEGRTAQDLTASSASKPGMPRFHRH